jgi:GTP-binding protein
MTPLVAIVGRPNVGKSTLFNRLAGEKLAIVHDAPGVTRDRNYADTHLQGRDLTLVDTGGFDPTTDDPMGQGIARHVRAAIAEADVVVCVLDGSNPPTGPDRDAVNLLRRSHKPVIYAANKVDGQSHEALSADLYALGLDEVIPVSALHGRNFGKLEAAIVRHLPPLAPEETSEEPEELLRIALVGRPNAGKSSLFNRLAGSERSLVDDQPGTTRDPIDSVVEFAGRRYVVVDTAGVRRKSRVERGVEAESVMRSLRAVARAHVVVLMCDVTEGIAEQDARLLGLCAERGRAIVVGLNKADLVAPRELTQRIEDARHALDFARWAPILGLSAKTGHGVRKLMDQVQGAGEDMERRVGTSELNRFFEQVLTNRPPPTKGGRSPRIYYMTQTGVRPPTFVAWSNAPENIAESYKRFVTNQIRQQFGFTAVPLRVFYRKRGRKED